MNNLEKIFEGNWDEIKGKLKSQWGKLTDNDIKHIDGSAQELIGRLKKAYGTEASEIENEIIQFLNANDVEEIKSKTKKIKSEVASKSEEIKEMVKECVNEYFDRVKNSTINAEEKVVEYCKSNPLKTTGLILLAGFAFATLIGKKK